MPGYIQHLLDAVDPVAGQSDDVRMIHVGHAKPDWTAGAPRKPGCLRRHAAILIFRLKYSHQAGEISESARFARRYTFG
jgi:hypothetical protein